MQDFFDFFIKKGEIPDRFIGRKTDSERGKLRKPQLGSAKGVLQINVSVRQIVLTADFFESGDGFFAELMLALFVGGTIKNSAGGKTIFIDAASAVLSIGTNPIRHHTKVEGQMMKKIQHFRRRKIEPMAVPVKITAGATRPANGLDLLGFHGEVVIDLPHPVKNLFKNLRRDRVFGFAGIQSVQNSRTFLD